MGPSNSRLRPKPPTGGDADPLSSRDRFTVAMRTKTLAARPRSGRASWAALVLATVLAHTGCRDETYVGPSIEAAVAPMIIKLAIADLTSSEATIIFQTDRPSTSTLEYGVTTAYGNATAGETSPTIEHQVGLTGLTHSTTYYYRITVHDAAEVSATSSADSFTTDVDRPPVVSGVGLRWLSSTQATLAWSTNEPAEGFVEYGTSNAYGNASGAETTPATSHGAILTGLEAGTTYHYRVTAYDSVGNESTTGDYTFTSAAEPSSGNPGIWLSSTDLAALPVSGPGWNNVLAEANGPCGAVDLANQDQRNNTCVLAKALAYARTGDPLYRLDVIDALVYIASAPIYAGRALAVGRELAAYVIAADIIGLQSFDPALDTLFRAAIQALVFTPTDDGPSSLAECHERRPNNWGTHCGASRAAVAAYLGDAATLDGVARVFKGWLGDRSSYAGFDYGDLSWQCDPLEPVGINPVGCTRDGYSIDGVLPDDQRRAGAFVWPPPKENYVWEALQGALVQAVILHRAGYPVWDWEDRALLRAVTWLHDQDGYPAEADDTWQPHILNYYYGVSFPAPVPATPGKNIGWSDWTHR